MPREWKKRARTSHVWWNFTREPQIKGAHVCGMKVGQWTKAKCSFLGLMFSGYRYVTRSKNGRYWKCSKKGCPATAKTFLPEDGVIRGYIGGVEPHNHPAEPQKLDAEERRNSIKRKIKEQPHLEQSRLLTEARAEATDEVFAAMGNDKALRQMAFRFFGIF